MKMVSRQSLIRTGVPHSVINFQFSAFGTIAWLLYNLNKGPAINQYSIWSLMIALMSGFCAVIVSLLYAQALKRENVQILGVVGSIDIIYAVLLEKLFLQYSCEANFVIGAFLIVLASILVCSVKLLRKGTTKLTDGFNLNRNLETSICFQTVSHHFCKHINRGRDPTLC